MRGEVKERAEEGVNCPEENEPDGMEMGGGGEKAACLCRCDGEVGAGNAIEEEDEEAE